jgi:hypothetical protein
MGGVIGLLDRARAAGLSITTDGDRLTIRGPRRADALARELIARKVEVMAELTEAAPAAESDSDPYPWRRVLPSWPVEWRQRWADRAEELTKAGVRWPHDDAQAFAEVSAERDCYPMPPAAAEPAREPAASTARPKEEQGRLSLGPSGGG